MFDLDREVNRWCKQSYPWPHYRRSQVVELEDHLHCVIEMLVEQGLGLEEAFERAITQMGESESLRREFRKNSHWFTKQMRRVESCPRPFVFAAITAFLFLGIGIALNHVDLFQSTRSFLVAIYSMPFKLFGFAVG